MESERPEHSDNAERFALADPVMDAALDWFARLQGYPDDHGLRAEFERWRRADPAHAAAFAEVSGVWHLPELDLIARDLADATDRIRPAGEDAAVLPFVRPRRKRRTYAAIAAAAALVIAVGVQQYPGLMLNWRADHRTATGMRAEVVLPDGSRMTLNTASAVALDFEGQKRSVVLLKGEAYFDVLPDASRPFTVAAAFSEVEVRGTAFAVRTEPDRDTLVLERGLVDVTRLTARKDSTTLRPGETVTATATALSAVSEADIATALSWKDGRLIFENQPFGQVLREIGRYHSGSIVVASDRVGQARVTGNYRLDDPERTVRSLAATVGGSVTRLPGGILILR